MSVDHEDRKIELPDAIASETASPDVPGHAPDTPAELRREA